MFNARRPVWQIAKGNAVRDLGPRDVLVAGIVRFRTSDIQWSEFSRIRLQKSFSALPLGAVSSNAFSTSDWQRSSNFKILKKYLPLTIDDLVSWCNNTEVELIAVTS